MNSNNILDISNLLRVFFLLSPVFVSLFWSIELRMVKIDGGVPQRFLAKFMIISGTLFFCQFLYFAPLEILFPYAEIPLAFLGLTIFPLYHIYFRILTVDKEFSFKAHARYLVVPVVIVSIYSVGIIFTDKMEFNNFLFNHTPGPWSGNVKFLKMMRGIIIATFMVELILTIIGNQLLLRKGENKAAHYYSDINDAENNYAKAINKTMIATAIVSMFFNSVGRSLLLSQNLMLYLGGLTFSVAIYIIGKQGIRAKLSCPGFDTENPDQKPGNWEKISLISGDKLLQRILFEFEQNKIYLNPELNIMDLSKKIGTNRSYLSLIINQKYNQNFCTFVNGFRIQELEKRMIENTDCSTVKLSESCGFGSTKTLKRAVLVKTGLSFPDFRKQLHKSKQLN